MRTGGAESCLSRARAILQAEGEAAGIAEALDWRRRQREGHGVRKTPQLGIDARRYGGGGIIRSAFAPVLQGGEGQTGILAGAGEGETRNRNHTIHRRLFHEDLFDLLDGLQRTITAGFRRCLNVNNQVALIFVRKERARQLHIRPAEADQQRRVNDHEAAGALDDAAD
ncbi:hypothetical protein D3C72_1448520 [compost metagenome]